MTTPNVETELYLPKTYVFKRGSATYSSKVAMSRIDAGGSQFVYLPKGLSLVTVTVTSMVGATLELTMNQGSDYTQTLATASGIKESTTRLWSGQISNAGTDFSDGGVYLRIFAERVTTVAMYNGSVSVQIVNFPPEN